MPENIDFYFINNMGIPILKIGNETLWQQKTAEGHINLWERRNMGTLIVHLLLSFKKL